jgi:hypothetical protein
VRRIAILVGNATFGPDSGIARLLFPIADVHEMEGLLRNAEIGNYDRVLSLIDKRSDEILC